MAKHYSHFCNIHRENPFATKAVLQIFFLWQEFITELFFCKRDLISDFFFLQQISCCRNSPRPGLLTFSKLWLGEVRMMMNHEKGNPNNSLQRLAATDFVAWQFTPAGSHVIEWRCPQPTRAGPHTLEPLGGYNKRSYLQINTPSVSKCKTLTFWNGGSSKYISFVK